MFVPISHRCGPGSSVWHRSGRNHSPSVRLEPVRGGHGKGDFYRSESITIHVDHCYSRCARFWPGSWSSDCPSQSSWRTEGVLTLGDKRPKTASRAEGPGRWPACPFFDSSSRRWIVCRRFHRGDAGQAWIQHRQSPYCVALVARICLQHFTTAANDFLLKCAE